MLLIIQNDPEVPPGNFADTIRGLNIPYRIVHPYAGEIIPPISKASAAIVLGGAMGVHDAEEHPFLVQVKAFVRDCVRTETPLLGVCLGGQLLADLLGGRVTANSPYGEKGTMVVTLTSTGKEDPLFACIPHEFVTFQWHNDSFEIPAGGTLLASSCTCAGQAFRFGASAWGTQFHPEVDRSIVGCWARWTGETAPHVERFLAGFILAEQSYLDVSRRLLVNFLRIAGFNTDNGTEKRP
jgi:GMP synthase (glutamine-hydrolysing)